ncbi:MAG: hypothetical protein AAGG45_07260 [Pseudomonadota bacterium]
MIQKLLASIGVVAALALPSAAQTFTHTINGVTHKHDITMYKTVGTCCVKVQRCHCSTPKTVVHHAQPPKCGTTVTYGHTHIPVHTQTYTRTYTHGPVTRTYTQPHKHRHSTHTQHIYVTRKTGY